MQNQYIDILRSHEVALIHCASQCILVGNSETASMPPLERLKTAISRDIVIAASTVQKGDQMTCPRTDRILNYTGPLGIIVLPSSESSITQANSSDSGSTPTLRERTRSDNLICDRAELERAITQRVNYNEIFIHTYKTCGIFISANVQFAINAGLMEITNGEIFDAFPNQTFYQLESGEFHKLTYNKSAKKFQRARKCSISEFYG